MNVLIAGGAGFVGSHISEEFLRHGHRVTVVDGLLAQTGGDPGNLPSNPELLFVRARVEDCAELTVLLDRSDLVVDCMGWTRHSLAMKDPAYDLELNVASHLHLGRAIAESTCRNLIHLGSRGQYGNVPKPAITEDESQFPTDVQGVHKVAAESHWRILSNGAACNVACLRFGNTYGERQPLTGPDVGLFATFLRDLLEDKRPELYGRSRMREFLYAPDLARVVLRLATVGFEGFEAYNVGGDNVALSELLDTMIRTLGKGEYESKEFPEEIKRLDVGGASLCDRKLRSHIGDFPITPVAVGIARLVESLTPSES